MPNRDGSALQTEAIPLSQLIDVTPYMYAPATVFQSTDIGDSEVDGWAIR